MYQKRISCLLALLFFTLFATAQAPKDSANTIRINAVGGLQYDMVRFQVKPGVMITIIFTNNDDMTHNLVVTLPGAREEVVMAGLKLGDQGIKMDYVPQTPKVLTFVKLLLPGESKSISFTTPKEAGVYPYVCTYPGHGFLMYGAMYVGDNPMPDIKTDPNIPDMRRVAATGGGHENHAGHAAVPEHPYPNLPPYVCRTFMPDAGPAAIAVSLPDSMSYCWDAGSCRLRYAWQGKFIDNADVWRGHKDGYAKILGTVFYKDKTAFPLHLGKPDNLPVVQFKGYQLVNGYPEFHYKIDGVDVFELVKSAKGGGGLTRQFRMPAATKTTWFEVDPGDGVTYTASAGQWVDGKLNLTPAEARRFTIIMTKKTL